VEVVLDTNVLACFLLGVPGRREEAQEAIRAADDIWAPDHLRAELANVIWQWSRRHGIGPAIALDLLRDGEGLVGRFVSSGDLWADALQLAMEREYPVYDTLFVALARLRGTRLSTYDRRLQRAFPEHVQSVGAFLAGQSDPR
jgi:predicted nucleic acid-binding protein